MRLDSWTPPLTRLLGDLGPPLVAICLHFGALWSLLASCLAAEGDQNEQHRPPKTKSIKKRPEKICRPLAGRRVGISSTLLLSILSILSIPTSFYVVSASGRIYLPEVFILLFILPVVFKKLGQF